jgi:xylulokinase
MEAAAFAVRDNLETMSRAGATIAGLRSSGGGAAGALWPQIVSDVTGLAQDVRVGPSRAGIGAALFAAVAAGAASLQTPWPQVTERMEPDPQTALLYEELYGWFKELAIATRPLAHALAAWQWDLARGRMSVPADREGAASDG